MEDHDIELNIKPNIPHEDSLRALYDTDHNKIPDEKITTSKIVNEFNSGNEIDEKYSIDNIIVHKKTKHIDIDIENNANEIKSDGITIKDEKIAEKEEGYVNSSSI